MCRDLEAVSAVDAGLVVSLPSGDVAGVLVPAVGGSDAVPQALRERAGQARRWRPGQSRVLARVRTN